MTAPPSPAAKPTFTCGSPIFTVGAAKMTSHNRAIVAPSPTAAPLSFAMIGFGTVEHAEHDPFHVRDVVDEYGGVVDHPLNVIQVSAGGECTPHARKNHDVGEWVDGQLGKETGDLVMRHPIDCIEALGPIERGSQKPALALEPKRRIA